MGFIVAIDGPAGSGKGTVTKKVAERLNLVNVDTGAMYRCVSLEILNQKIKLEEEEKIQKILDTIDIEYKKTENEDKIFLNGKDVTKNIREKEVNDIVSKVSIIAGVREKMVNLQREFSEGKNVIMEGRDIGTKVFPNADVKIYLDASAEERANRRMKQNLEKGINITYEEILSNIKYRDKTDSTRKIDPLRQAEDAIYIDSSNMTIEEVTEKIIEIIKQKGYKN